MEKKTRITNTGQADAPGLDWLEDPLWYKDAIIYQLHVKAFYDANGDGIGDFRGLIEKLDYVQELGANTIWLLPFYPSPLRDDGYDIADYRGVHPDYGTRADFRRFVREAHDRNLRVLTELVINHTSDQHPWFQAARRAPPGSAKRRFYVWSETDTKYPETRIIFTDTEGSNWAWDPVARSYYWHRFFSHQPDLNYDNPQTLKAVVRVLHFWMDMGVDGMRLDAIPYLIEREGTNNENLPETHAVIKQIRAALDERYDDRMFLGEANQWPEDVREYFGEGDECHMAYHFPLMPRMYMAMALEDRHPIVEIMGQTPDIPDNCQWAIFLRNHDELTLEMVTDRERDYMYQTYAAEMRARINLGIRRRLAPLMDNDPDRIKLMNSLLLSMPGSPIIYYGDEIGMGDNIFLGDRNGVRTPMQWSPDRNAGFSRADPQRLYLPPVMDPIYGHQAVNVEAQARDPSSLLNWTRRILAVRKEEKAFGRGTLAFLRPGNRKILAYVREYQDAAILCVANLSRKAQPVELDLARFRGRVPVEMMGRVPFPPIGELPYLLTLPAHGYYWFRLGEAAETPAWHEERLAPAETAVLVLYENWTPALLGEVQGPRRDMAARLRDQLEREVLPGWLNAQRWYADKTSAVNRVTFSRLDEWRTADGRWWLAVVDVRIPGDEPHCYFLPLGIAWEEEGEEKLHTAMPAALAKVRLKARVGWLYDASGDADFCRALVHAVGAGENIPLAGAILRCIPSLYYPDLAGDPLPARVRSLAQGSSNTAAVLEDRLFLKLYRRVQAGTSSEVEVSRYLTEAVHYPNAVRLAGSIELVADSGEPSPVAMLQAYVKNQGDCWNYTLDYLGRYLDQERVAPLEEALERAPTHHEPFLLQMQTLGRRTGELHAAFASGGGDPAFEPEPITRQDLISWRDRIAAEAEQTLDLLQDSFDRLGERERNAAAVLLRRRRGLVSRIGRLAPAAVKAVKTRYHGDYHLGQVLIAENDFLIIDFEGEPARSLEERRARHSPLRDVAGMLRSFAYAAAVVAMRESDNRPAELSSLERLTGSWERLTAGSFLAGYRIGVGQAACAPSRADHTRRLVELFTLEKALYETRYELNNRPAWTGIPLQGLLKLLDAPRSAQG